MRFRNREDAGCHLADLVCGAGLRAADVVVLALPRGGVPVGYQVAGALGAPLDVLVVRKLGVPFQPELAMGAIGEGGVRVENADVLRSAGVDPSALEAVEQRERGELERRASHYRGGRGRLDLEGRIAVIVDDGIATGSTVRAACSVARQHGAARIIVAVPVASRPAMHDLGDVCDDVLCVAAPDPFFAVGEWYSDFSQTSDEEVVSLLARAAASRTESTSEPSQGEDRARSEDVMVLSGTVNLPGRLTVPEGAVGTVVFAHGSGSSRHSPRNRFVAESLHQAGFATLLVDLLTEDEELDRRRVFDIPLLAGRLGDAARWISDRPQCPPSALGFFGASTGAAAALQAAATADNLASAVVSRGGRPDLAGSSLADVEAPTLLIVGERDERVLELNKTAQREMRCTCELAVVPGATHLFEESGALESVAKLACGWFERHLCGLGAPRRSHRPEPA